MLVSDPNPRVVDDMHREIAIGAALTWNDIGYEATFILVERAPIRWAVYVMGDRRWASARRIQTDLTHLGGVSLLTHPTEWMDTPPGHRWTPP
jgi:hypothetical protein